jgi:hypothetical protein
MFDCIYVPKSQDILLSALVDIQDFLVLELVIDDSPSCTASSYPDSQELSNSLSTNLVTDKSHPMKPEPIPMSFPQIPPLFLSRDFPPDDQ